MNGIERKRNPRNVVDSLRRRAREVEQLKRRDIVVNDLSEISEDLGAHYSGQLLAITASDPTEVEANGAFFDADGVEFSDGELYHVGGVNNGQLMFGLRAEDGAGVFAGGAGVIDRFGQHMTGIRYALEHLAADPDGDNPRRGAIEMFYPDGATIPAYRLRFGEADEFTELVTNGDFATGDTSGWTATLTGASTFAASLLVGVGYRGRLYRAAGQSGSVVSNAFAVTPGNHYRARLLASGAGADAVTITARVDWYDAGASLLSSSTIMNVTKNQPGGQANTGWQTINTSVTAPAGAATAQVYLTVSAGGTLEVTDVSTQLIGIDHSLVFDDNGFSVLRWSPPRRYGRGHDRNTSSSYTCQIMTVRVLRPMRLHEVRWDLRNSGTYALKLLWSANIANNMRTLWSGSGAVGVNTIPLAEPEVLLPGLHYLGMERTSGSTTWWDYNAATYTEGDELVSPGLSDPAWMAVETTYNTSGFAYVTPAQLGIRVGRYS